MKGEDMADRMEFPKTMKEFIEGYSFKDSDEVYTNGSELVPVFRVEQALEHYEQESRNKAIDEFVEAICNKAYKKNDFITMRIGYLKELAEQMKEGGKDA